MATRRHFHRIAVRLFNHAAGHDGRSVVPARTVVFKPLDMFCFVSDYYASKTD